MRINNPRGWIHPTDTFDVFHYLGEKKYITLICGEAISNKQTSSDHTAKGGYKWILKETVLFV